MPHIGGGEEIPPFKVKHFEYPEKRYINVTNRPVAIVDKSVNRTIKKMSLIFFFLTETTRKRAIKKVHIVLMQHFRSWL